LDSLKKDTAVSRSNVYAPGTQSNLRSQWKTFFMFCFYFGLQPIPVSTETLCLFAQFLLRSVKSVSAIKTYVAGVRTLHLFLDTPSPPSLDFNLKLTLKGIAKNLKHVPLQKLPITPVMLAHFLDYLDLSVELHLSFWTCCLFAFFLCARKSNLLPQSKNKCFDNTFLLRSDVTKLKHRLVVCIKWSKTNQTNEKFLTIPIFRIKYSAL
jgi:hypothetical protein